MKCKAARSHVEHWSVQAGKKEQSKKVISIKANSRAKDFHFLGTGTSDHMSCTYHAHEECTP